MTVIEILALTLVAGQPTTFKLNQSFWQHRYQVAPKTWLVKFEQANLLQRKVAPELSLQQQTVNALKTLLRAHNLKVSGRKAELISRLQAAIPATELAIYFPQSFYQLTTAGAHLVDQNQTVRWIHDHYVAGIIDFQTAEQAQLPADIDLDATLDWLLNFAQANAQSDWAQRYYIEHLRFQFAWQAQHIGTALNALLDCIRFKLAGLAQTEPITVLSLGWPTTTYKIEPFYKYMLQKIMHDYDLAAADVITAFQKRQQLLVFPHQLFSDLEMDQLLLWTLTEQNQRIQQLYLQKQKGLLCV